MKIKLLTQGIHKNISNSVGELLISLLQEDRFDTFIGISAFASYSGVTGLGKFINDAKKHLNKIVIVVGVDQKGTSKEALGALEGLGVDSYVFYQASFPIFHPKVYLFEGKDSAAVIIGSSNMTAQGLFLNSEASLYIELDKEYSEDCKFLDEVTYNLEALINQEDDNIKKINSELIDKLVSAGIVPNEIDRQKIYDSKGAFSVNKKQNDISDLFPARKNISSVPSEFRRSRTSKLKPTTKEEVTPNLQEGTYDGSLVWTSTPLTERDLNIPTGPNTSATGSMSLTKGEMTDVDQRHYFREDVFESLKWKHDTTKGREHYERAYANFIISIDGQNYGPYNLRLSHNTRTDTPSYRQGNYMTHVSWGEAKPIVAKPELLGKKAYLYKMSDNDFLLKID